MVIDSNQIWIICENIAKVLNYDSPVSEEHPQEQSIWGSRHLRAHTGEQLYMPNNAVTGMRIMFGNVF